MGTRSAASRKRHKLPTRARRAVTGVLAVRSTCVLNKIGIFPPCCALVQLLHLIGDFERIADHAVNIIESAEELKEKGVSFTDSAKKELQTMLNAVSEIVDLTSRAFLQDDLTLARQVEPLEQVIDLLIAEAKSTHIERLQSGVCTIEMGFVLSDLLTNYERVSDHCSNIAVALIETHAGSFGTHEYLNAVKETGSHEFAEVYRDYKEKYRLPESE